MPGCMRLPKNTEEVCGRAETSAQGRDPDGAEQRVNQYVVSGRF